MREEIVQLSDGVGRIRIHISGGCSLRFDDKPVIFSWGDRQGSIGEYLVRGVPVEEYQAVLDAIRTLVSGQDFTLSLADSLQGLLRLFESGQYLLQETVADEYFAVVAFSHAQDITTNHNSMYPHSHVLVCTQPQEYLCSEQVAEYKTKILHGERPLLLTTGLYRNRDVLFVLDGHHKLQAYQELNIRPSLITILYVTAPFVDYTEDALFGCAQALRTHFAKVKAPDFSDVTELRHNDLPLPIGISAELFKAIEEHQLEKVIMLLQQAPHLVTVINEAGETPLMNACRQPDMPLAIISEILQYPQTWDIEDYDGGLPLHHAVSYERLDVIVALLDAGYPIELFNSDLQTALTAAACYGKLNSLKYLVSRGALVNPRQENPLIYAFIHNHKETMRYLLSQGANPSHNPICHYWSKKPFSILDEGHLQNRYWQMINEIQN